MVQKQLLFYGVYLRLQATSGTNVKWYNQKITKFYLPQVNK